MVLLHLLRSCGLDLPVAFFREPWQPRKYAFHDGLIREWELQVMSWHPSEVAYQQTDDEFELQNLYRVGPAQFTCPTGIVPPTEGARWECALEMGRRPTQEGLSVYPNFQCFWIGHKGCDTDVVLGGAAGTAVQATCAPDGAMMCFPLRDWSHDDVWEYIEVNDVPYDSDRYEKYEGKWREKPGRLHNADYVHACTACIDRREEAPQVVHCPRFQCEVENISHRLPWVEPRKLTYMVDP